MDSISGSGQANKGSEDLRRRSDEKCCDGRDGDGFTEWCKPGPSNVRGNSNPCAPRSPEAELWQPSQRHWRLRPEYLQCFRKAGVRGEQQGFPITCEHKPSGPTNWPPDYVGGDSA